MSENPVFFADQVNIESYLLTFFYIFATVGIMLGISAIICIDAGLVRAKNMFTTIVQKVAASFIGGVSFMVIGYGIWNWQYYEAFSIPSPLLSAIGDWWLLGPMLTTFSQKIDPAATPHADLYQVFAVFFFCFGSIASVLIHGAGLERIKSSATYITSIVVGGVLVPVIAYLTYGSLSPLTNNGMHDFVGAYSLYMIVGTWSIVLAWRLGPRIGGVVAPGNATLLSIGVLLLMVAIPMFVIGCGFMVPGKGYYGPTMADTGLGIIFINIFMAMGGGGIAGAILAHIYGKPGYILLGPIAGYVACSALFDIATPVQALLIALVGPVLLVASEKILLAVKIDEPKVAPLTFLPAVFSALAAGVIGSGVKQGGYFGITEGAFAFQAAQVSLGIQIAGIAVVVGLTAVMALIVTFAIEKTIGLRVTPDVERNGMDASLWKPVPIDPDAADVPVAAV